jgi:hypothetical protein
MAARPGRWHGTGLVKRRACNSRPCWRAGGSPVGKAGPECAPRRCAGGKPGNAAEALAQQAGVMGDQRLLPVIRAIVSGAGKVGGGRCAPVATLVEQGGWADGSSQLPFWLRSPVAAHWWGAAHTCSTRARATYAPALAAARPRQRSRWQPPSRRPSPSPGLLYECTKLGSGACRWPPAHCPPGPSPPCAVHRR